MRFNLDPHRRGKVTPMTVFVIVVAALLIASLTMQRWYAHAKRDRMDACADFSSMPPVSKAKRELETVVLIGDSRIAEWPSDAFDGHFQVLNWGLPGGTIPEIICGLNRYSQWRGADIYVVQAGINDLVAINAVHRWFPERREKAIHQTGREWAGLVNLVAAGGERVFLLETLRPYRLDVLRSFFWGPHVSHSATVLKQMQMKLDYPANAQYVELAPLFVDDETWRWKDEYHRDALHWYPIAYRAIESKIHRSR